MRKVTLHNDGTMKLTERAGIWKAIAIYWIVTKASDKPRYWCEYVKGSGYRIAHRSL